MKTIIHFLAFLLLCITRLAAQNDSVSTTLSALPDYDTGSGMAARINTITVTLDKDAVHAKPGQGIGWGYKIQWQSNAGDRLSFGTSACVGDLSPVSAVPYTDIIGVIGGNVDGHVAAGTSWQSAFVANTQGLGYVTISPNATPGAQFFGEIRLTFSIHDNSADLGKFIATRTLTLPVTITVDEPDPVMAQDQTITFETIPAKTIGDPPFTIVATSSSGLPVEIYSRFPDVCTVNGNIATIHSAGTCVIMVEQPGNAAFHPANAVSQTIVIAKQPAALALTGSTDRTYSGSAQNFGTSTTPPSLPVTILYNGETTAPTNPGVYVVDAFIEDPNFSGSTNAILNINNVITPTLTTFQDWINQRFTAGELLDPNISGLSADPDLDGNTNLLEYAFGFDPKNVPSAAERASMLSMAEITPQANSVIFEIPAEAPSDLTFVIQCSSDLSTGSWSEIARRQGDADWTGSAEVFTYPPSGGRTRILVTEMQQAPPKLAQFYRLHVIKNTLNQ